MCDVLCDVMTAFANWLYGQELFSAVDPCLLAEHDTAVTEQDVGHLGERSTWPILLEPAVVPLDDNSLALGIKTTELSI